MINLLHPVVFKQNHISLSFSKEKFHISISVIANEGRESEKIKCSERAMSDERDLLRKLSDRSLQKISVVGDYMLDSYVYGVTERVSPEAPVPIVRVQNRDSLLGGAGNAVENLAGLGAQGIPVGVVGNDETGDLIQAKLSGIGCNCDGLVKNRPNLPT
jgi:hypothetical protein